MRLKSAKGAYSALPDLLAGEERFATPFPKRPPCSEPSASNFSPSALRSAAYSPSPRRKNSWHRRWYTGKVTGIPVPAGTGTGTATRVRVGYG